jgi:hypothetical protein
MTAIWEVIWHVVFTTVPASDKWDVSERVTIVCNTKGESILVMFVKENNVPVIESDIRPTFASPHHNDADCPHFGQHVEDSADTRIRSMLTCEVQEWNPCEDTRGNQRS